MTVRLVLGLLFTVVAFAVAGRRVWWLSRLIRTGQPAPGRMDGVPARLRAEVAEVFGQRKLLKWSVPGVAHFLTFWGFIVLILTIIEAWGGAVRPRLPHPVHRPLAGGRVHRGLLRGRRAGRHRDVRDPADPAGAGPAGSGSRRFYGSHTRAAWVILGMIALVVITLLIYRGAQINTGVFPFGDSPWAFASWTRGQGAAPAR